MITRPLSKLDYDHIVQVIDRWWGGPTTALAHPIFFYELGRFARVVEHEQVLVGFLLGFVAPGRLPLVQEGQRPEQESACLPLVQEGQRPEQESARLPLVQEGQRPEQESARLPEGDLGQPATGYVHLVGIHPDYRRRGVGKILYQTFEEDSRAAGCARLKAITTLGNEGSIAFHKALGWSVTFVEDYAGPARPRVVFQKNL